MRIHLSTAEDRLHFAVDNSKDSGGRTSSRGIGLENVRQRLSLLYPGSHDLNITEGADEYSVRLSLPLRACADRESPPEL